MPDTYDLRSGAATIVIDEGPYAGVEVAVLLDAPYRVRREMRRLVTEYRDAEPFSDEEGAALNALYAAAVGIADPPVLLSWNVTEDGEPVPLTVAGLHRSSPQLVLHVITTWWSYVGTVMPPLPGSSPSTASDSTSTDGEWSDGPESEASGTPSAVLSTP